jgi:hypothetical protein
MQKKSNSAVIPTYKPSETNKVNETSIAFFWACVSFIALMFYAFGA